MKAGHLNRRGFLRSGLTLAAGVPAVLYQARQQLLAGDAGAGPVAGAPAGRRGDTVVAVEF
jgi:hypothetical protein